MSKDFSEPPNYKNKDQEEIGFFDQWTGKVSQLESLTPSRFTRTTILHFRLLDAMETYWASTVRD